jgi:hypothetical protein
MLQCIYKAWNAFKIRNVERHRRHLVAAVFLDERIQISLSPADSNDVRAGANHLFGQREAYARRGADDEDSLVREWHVCCYCRCCPLLFVVRCCSLLLVVAVPAMTQDTYIPYLDKMRIWMREELGHVMDQKRSRREMQRLLIQAREVPPYIPTIYLIKHLLRSVR